MATTSLDVDTSQLVASNRKEATDTRSSGETVTKTDPARYRKLLAYLNRLAAKTCPWYLRNEQDDIVQTVLIRLEQKLEKEGKEVLTKSYIKRGLHWAILDARKRFMGLGEVLSGEDEDGSQLCDRLPDETSWQRALVIREEISDCLSHLDEGKRRATMLALQGYQCSEIAIFLDLSIRQAESRIRRGKAFLKRCLKLKGVVP